jgi:hypothetical protein
LEKCLATILFWNQKNNSCNIEQWDFNIRYLNQYLTDANICNSSTNVLYQVSDSCSSDMQYKMMWILRLYFMFMTQHTGKYFSLDVDTSFRYTCLYIWLRVYYYISYFTYILNCSFLTTGNICIVGGYLVHSQWIYIY